MSKKISKKNKLKKKFQIWRVSPTVGMLPPTVGMFLLLLDGVPNTVGRFPQLLKWFPVVEDFPHCSTMLSLTGR